MKTIEQKQIELFPIMSDKKSIEQTDTFTGQEIVVLQRTVFNIGVQFAEEWIDVNDELPELRNTEEWLSEDVLLMVDVPTDEQPFCVVGAYNYKWSEFIELWESSSIPVTHWRPINRK